MRHPLRRIRTARPTAPTSLADEPSARTSRRLGRPSARVAGVTAGVVSLALVTGSAHAWVGDQRARESAQAALDARAGIMQAAVDRDGGRTALPASRSRAVMSTERLAVPFGTITKRTTTLLRGTTKVVQQGRNGVLLRRWQHQWVDGHDVERTLVSERVLREPVDRIVHIGTRVPPSPTPSRTRETLAAGSTTTLSQPTRTSSSTGWPKVAGAEGLNWTALAKCESSGNPTAVNWSGPYYGLYQFLASTWRSVGGSGLPHQASAGEQTYRAKLLYARSGAGQWPTCGRLLFT